MSDNREAVVIRSPRRYLVGALGLLVVLVSVAMPFSAARDGDLLWGIAFGVPLLACAVPLFLSAFRSRVEVDARTVRHWRVFYGRDEVPRSDIAGLELAGGATTALSVAPVLVLREGEDKKVSLAALSWFRLPGFPEPRRLERLRDALDLRTD